MQTTLSRTPLRFTSALTLLALVASARQAQPAAPDAGDWRGTWARTGDLVSPSYASGAMLLPDGNVLLAGRAGNSEVTNSQIYEVAAGRWAATSPLKERRAGHTLTLLLNGKVLAAGGWNSSHDLLASAELFDPALRTWTKTGAMRSAHNKHTATLLPDGEVLVTGNVCGTNDLVVTELDDPATGTRRRTVLSLQTLPREGTDGSASAELYDPLSGTWKCTGPLKEPRGHHTATLLTNGLVLLAGGTDAHGAALSSAELYDPHAETWTEVAGLHQARAYHTATLLPNGIVLVLGGQDTEGRPFAEAELFNPATRQWTATRAMMFARSYHTTTLLQNGKVLVVGGSSLGGTLKFVEWYDPATAAWSRPKPMATARYWHTATLLPSGKVLVAGGVGVGWHDPFSTAELFDPSPREE